MTPKTMNTPFENSFMELTGEEYESALKSGGREASAPHEVSRPADFILAGKAYFTLRSVKTGNRFTYRVAQTEQGDAWFVSLLNGPDNWSNYLYMGLIGRDRRFRLAKGSKVSAEASSARAFAWTWARVAAGQPVDGVEIWHEGKCGRCGRKLTVPESVASGLGPECAGKLEGGM